MIVDPNEGPRMLLHQLDEPACSTKIRNYHTHCIYLITSLNITLSADLYLFKKKMCQRKIIVIEEYKKTTEIKEWIAEQQRC